MVEAKMLRKTANWTLDLGSALRAGRAIRARGHDERYYAIEGRPTRQPTPAYRFVLQQLLQNRRIIHFLIINIVYRFTLNRIACPSKCLIADRASLETEFPHTASELIQSKLDPSLRVHPTSELLMCRLPCLQRRMDTGARL